MATRKDNRPWFKVIIEYELPLVHILRAPGLPEIDEHFMLQMFDYQVVQLSWFAMSKLTGCIIPPKMNPLAMARGDLLFKNEGELFVLTCVNELGS